MRETRGRGNNEKECVVIHFVGGLCQILLTATENVKSLSWIHFCYFYTRTKPKMGPDRRKLMASPL